MEIGHDTFPLKKLEGGLRKLGKTKESQPEKPLVTVITVVFNGEKFIEKTIQSVLCQDYKNIEFIVIDGGSIDGTLDIIKKYEHSIDYWVSEKDQGIYNAMNKGIDLSKGDWTNFLNAADEFYDCDVLNNATYRELAKNARKKTVEEFDSKKVAVRYIELYRSTLSTKPDNFENDKSVDNSKSAYL